MSSLKSILNSKVGEKGKEAAERQGVEIMVSENQLLWSQEIGTMKLTAMRAANDVTSAQGNPKVTVAEYLRLQRVVAALAADVAAAETAFAARFSA
jgi:hypothetical protein